MRMSGIFLKTRQASLFGKGGVKLGEVYLNVAQNPSLVTPQNCFISRVQPLFLPLRLIGSATRGSSHFFLDSHRAPIIFSRQFDVNLDAPPSSPLPMIEDSTSEAWDTPAVRLISVAQHVL